MKGELSRLVLSSCLVLLAPCGYCSLQVYTRLQSCLEEIYNEEVVVYFYFKGYAMKIGNNLIQLNGIEYI